MTKATLICASVAVAVGALASTTHAGEGPIPFFDAFYSAYYFQTSAQPPEPSTTYRVAFRVFDLPGFLTGATVNLPSPAGLTLPLHPNGDASVFIYASPPFATLADAVATFPLGQYNYDVTLAGSGDMLSGSLNSAPALPEPSAVPQFDAATVQLLQSNPPAGQDLNLGFNTFQTSEPGNLAVTFVTLYRMPGGEVDFNDFFLGIQSTVTIPADSLLPNTQYAATLFFSARVEQPTNFLLGATSIVARDNVTTFSFTTGPSLATCLADVASDSSDQTRTPNGSVGPEDLEAFVNGYIAENPAIADVASDSSDTTYNPNGSVGPEDLEAFVNAFIAGC